LLLYLDGSKEDKELWREILTFLGATSTKRLKIYADKEDIFDKGVNQYEQKTKTSVPFPDRHILLNAIQGKSIVF
jgi:hypothetical protein